ncbi:hypothetical protein J6590_014081 [Homalodisca vitripennis]|nr:hypothetical protein J6590_014081 [Homalodisca vitripennis]
MLHHYHYRYRFCWCTAPRPTFGGNTLALQEPIVTESTNFSVSNAAPLPLPLPLLLVHRTETYLRWQYIGLTRTYRNCIYRLRQERVYCMQPLSSTSSRSVEQLGYQRNLSH